MQIEVGIAWNRDGSGFRGMAEMMVTTPDTYQTPTILLQYSNDVPHFHERIMFEEKEIVQAGWWTMNLEKAVETRKNRRLALGIARIYGAIWPRGLETP